MQSARQLTAEGRKRFVYRCSLTKLTYLANIGLLPLASLKFNETWKARISTLFHKLASRVLSQRRDCHNAFGWSIRCENLETQLNNLTELHQHEVAVLKQELSSMEEKVEYHARARARDMQVCFFASQPCSAKINGIVDLSSPHKSPVNCASYRQPYKCLCLSSTR